MKSKIILFDIDYTLFDTGLYRDKVFQQLCQLIGFSSQEEFFKIAMQTYDEVRKGMYFDPKLFTHHLLTHISTPISAENLEKIWWDKNILISSLYNEVEGVLQKLKDKSFVLGIFSSGHTTLQPAKIDIITKYFNGKHIHIHPFKDDLIPEILTKYSTQELFVVDDFPLVLEKLQSANKNVYTIWIQRGRIAEENMIVGFHPNKTIKNLSEIPSLFDK